MMEEREDSSGGERICGEKLIPSKPTDFEEGGGNKNKVPISYYVIDQGLYAP